MHGVRIALLIAVAALASGCAGQQYHQDLARLQSQVGLLEERLTQVERSGIGPSASTSLSEPSGSAAVGVEALMQAPTAPKHASTGGKASNVPSGRPGTREIQQALKNAGFYQGAVDGKMGAMTHEAIQEFQRINGLKDDGVVGKDTWAKLRAYAELSSNSSTEVLK